MLRDEIRSAFRTVTGRPRFSFSVIVVLAFGIAANSAIFSLVDAVLFSPLAGVQEPQKIFRIFAESDPQLLMDISDPAYKGLRDRSHSFTGIAAFNSYNGADLRIPGGPAERISVCLISENYFDVLGVRPQFGRLINNSDEHNDGNPVVVSDQFWKKEFGSRPESIGSTILLNGNPFTVVGVVPPDFHGASISRYTNIWAPVRSIDLVSPKLSAMLNEDDLPFWGVVGRIRPHVTQQEAQAELRTIGLERAQPNRDEDEHLSISVVSSREALAQDMPSASRFSWALTGIVAFVLAMSCAVAAGLFLLRAEQRHHEISVRLALGASRNEVLRQLLLESFLLSIIASILGLVLASWIADFFVSFSPVQFPIPLNAASSVLHIRTIVFTIFLSVLSALFFGAIPAFRASRFPLLYSLQKQFPSTGRRFSLQGLLVFVQVAICTVLLTGAGLFLRTLFNANSVELGFSADSTFSAQIDLSKESYSKENGLEFFSQLLQRVRKMEGVQNAGLASTVPVDFVPTTSFKLDPKTRISWRSKPDFNIVTSGYFESMKIRVLRGRDFQTSDTSNSPAVVVINEAMAKRFWPGQDAVGETLYDVGRKLPSAKIIGIVDDAKYLTLREPASPMIYVALDQYYSPDMTMVIRTAGESRSALADLRSAISEMNPNLPIFDAGSIKQRVDRSISSERMISILITSFGIFALFLAAMGLYSVVSFTTELRTREVGVRMALGATQESVRTMVLWKGLGLTIAGVLAGFIVASFCSRMISSYLFGVSSSDPMTYFAIAAILILSALLASYLPARRATRINPLEALRYE